MQKRSPREPVPATLDAMAEDAYGLRYINSQVSRELAHTVLQQAESDGDWRAIARALVASGAARAWLSELDAAAAELERALDILETHPDPIIEARALAWQGMIARRRADYSASMRLSADALALFWSAGDRAGEGEALRMVGTVQWLVGDFVSALERFAESRQICEDLDDRHGLALCANDMAIAHFELGEHESALQAFEEALAWFRQMGAVSTELPTLSNLGSCYRERGDHELARAYLTECIELCRKTGERLPEARAHYNLGRLYRDRGDPQRALTYFTDAEELSRALGERRTEIGAMIGGARVLLLSGETQRGMEKLVRAREAAESCGIQQLVAEAHEALADAFERTGDLEAAIRHLRAFHEMRERVQRAGAALRAQYRQALIEQKRVQQETELQVLKAQLQPHFLFNSLTSLAALIRLDPEEASRMVVHLGELLRLALVQSSDQCTRLEAEIEFVSAYLKLEQVCYRHRFSYSIEVEPGLGDVQVPHLLLQPLAENAIRHGFARSETESRLEIRAQRISASHLLLAVRDTGVGLQESRRRKVAGVGLRNTRLRLQRLYGADQDFRIGPGPGGGTLVEIRLPLARSAPAIPLRRASGGG